MRGFIYQNRQYFYFIVVVIGMYLFGAFFLPRVKIPEVPSAITLDYLKFNSPFWVHKQIIAFTIFFATVVGTLLFWQYRVAIASTGIAILLLTGVMDLETTVKFMNIPIILFIIAIMTVVAYLEYTGTLKFCVIWIIKKVGANPRYLYIILLLTSVILSGFVGEVSAIAVTTTLAIIVARTFEIETLPIIIGLVFATNVGSALTLVGNPIGIYIAFAGKLTFTNFARWATPLAFVSAVIITYFTLWLFRRKLPGRQKISSEKLTAMSDMLDLYFVLRDKKKFITSTVIFVILILFVAFHGSLEKLLSLRETTVIIGIALFIVGIIIFIEKEEGRRFLVEGVDWWTIVFFMFLFANAACLEYTGVTHKLAYLIEDVARKISIPFLPGDISPTVVAFALLLWTVGILSGFVDNLPIVAAMVPIVKELRLLGLPHAGILWWALLFGGCFGGNLTMIGSSANMVALSIYEKSIKRGITFKMWFKYGLPVAIISLIFAMIILLFQINLSS